MYIGTYYSLSSAAVKKDELILMETLEESIDHVISTNSYSKVLRLTKYWALIDVTQPGIVGAKKKPAQARLLLAKNK
ncbi:hypothetical protein EIJ81_00190 (plasmid) [Aliivibrio salmonicida]|uniref:hypothetical protein n=1 Tax=Aliivibrio salmonicida TaxID=40269 RepID=UPI000F71788B|nr:hypothetical protein [Aliivibrio salmonicida]AZL83323.1 hypothetical protein EIJ81_00190 [Aliivibrio salmonicida]